MPNDNTHDELTWQAFRYIAGEMCGDEQERFADRLTVDQAAREAVAAAVEVSQATVMALATQSMSRRRAMQRGEPRKLRWLWVVGATAACIAVMWGASQFAARSNWAGAQQTAALAEQWSEIREQSPSTTLEDEFDEGLLAMEEDETLDAAPEWMLAALVEQQDASDMGELPGEIESHIEESREQ